MYEEDSDRERQKGGGGDRKRQRQTGRQTDRLADKERIEGTMEEQTIKRKNV